MKREAVVHADTQNMNGSIHSLLRLVIVFGLVCTLYLVYITNKTGANIKHVVRRESFLEKGACPVFKEPIDIVYTWVNGSDPTFQYQFQVWSQVDESSMSVNTKVEELNDAKDMSRYADFDQLKYSLRSLEMYAPWFRNIYFVTNGQAPPVWLNVDHPRLKIVTHKEIFENADDLPTFSSPAIEMNLHRIQNLSEKYLYMNDDINFMKPVCPSEFFHRKTYRLYWSLWVKCHDDCDNIKVANGECNQECNNYPCDYDGGDCPKPSSNVIKDAIKSDTRNSYKSNLDYTNTLMNKKISSRGRQMVPHMPLFFNKNIVQDLSIKFSDEWRKTSATKFRNPKNLQYAFLYQHFLAEQTNSKNGGKHKHEVIWVDKSTYKRGYKYLYNYIDDNFTHTKEKMYGFMNYTVSVQWKKSRNWFVCLNDGMSHKPVNDPQKLWLKRYFYEFLWPRVSSFEKDFQRIPSEPVVRSKSSAQHCNTSRMVLLSILLYRIQRNYLF